MTTATAPRRSALVPAECPIDFAEIDSLGGCLKRVVGPPQFAAWAGEYSPSLLFPNCVLCDQPVDMYKAHDDPMVRCVLTLPDGSLRWGHSGCATRHAGHKSQVEGWVPRREQPPCARCGAPWDDHERTARETLSCPSSEDGTQLYEHAPGVVGPRRPDWLNQVAHA